MPDPVYSDPTAPFQRKWMHSHEEDTDGLMCFRPAERDFPPSRGREGFELRPGGAMTEMGIAAADGTVESEAGWELVARPDGQQLLKMRSPSGYERVLEVVSIEPDRLVVRYRS